MQLRELREGPERLYCVPVPCCVGLSHALGGACVSCAPATQFVAIGPIFHSWYHIRDENFVSCANIYGTVYRLRPPGQ